MHSHKLKSYSSLFPKAMKGEDLFLWEGFGRCCQRLKIACEQKYPILSLQGNNGVGKSSAIKWLQQNLSIHEFEFFHTAITSTELQEGWLLQRFSKYLGILENKDFKLVMLQKIQELLESQQHFIFVIENAERIKSSEAFTEIERLLEFQNISGSVFTFIFVSSEDILKKFLEINPTFSDHLAMKIEIKNPSLKEWKQFTQEYLNRASLSKEIIDDGALAAVHQLTDGNLKKMILLCENSLIEMQIHQSPSCTIDHVRTAAESALIDVSPLEIQKVETSSGSKEENLQKKDTKQKNASHSSSKLAWSKLVDDE